MSASRGGRRGRHGEEEHGGDERWLLTYADMITLLMALFMVLFSISSVNISKFKTLQESNDPKKNLKFWANIHGAPLGETATGPCEHNSELIWPWHRAYLYFFEKALQDIVPGLTLPWWDWTRNHQQGIPPAYATAQTGGEPNPLFDSPIQPAGRRKQTEERTWRNPPGPGGARRGAGDAAVGRARR